MGRRCVIADTKISDLPTDVVTLADGDKFPIADASALTIDTFATALEIKTHGNTAPLWAAGSASANTWPRLTAGTLLTTAQAGALEMANDTIYATSEAGNRGVLTAFHFIRQAASRTLTSSTAEQKLFDSVAGGALSLATGTYFFDALFSISALSATSGNAAFDLLGAGTAVFADVLYSAVGIDGATATAATQTGSTMVLAQSPASIVTAGTATAMQALLQGTFEITTAGTIIPSVTLLTAAAGVVAAGTYFKCHRVGAINVTAVGDWA